MKLLISGASRCVLKAQVRVPHPSWEHLSFVYDPHCWKALATTWGGGEGGTHAASAGRQPGSKLHLFFLLPLHLLSHASCGVCCVYSTCSCTSCSTHCLCSTPWITAALGGGGCSSIFSASQGSSPPTFRCIDA